MLLLTALAPAATPESRELPANYSEDGPGIAPEYLNLCPVADGFDYPIGKPNARGYYNAQGFRKNRHLGDDWNGTGGGDTDLGDPIFSAAHGIVVSARTESGSWGNVIRILHNKGTKHKPVFVETLYAHMLEMQVKPGDLVKRGQKIGTMGNANGVYKAHLHLEIRTTINLPVGTGYSEDTTGYVDPTRFIALHRPRLRHRARRVATVERAQKPAGVNTTISVDPNAVDRSTVTAQ